MNKYEAAYNMLMILSVVDGEFQDNEGDIIIEYLRSMHEPFVGTKHENKILSELSNDQLIHHFKDACFEFYKKHQPKDRLKIFEGSARDFYEHSLASDRNMFIEFAKKMIIADHKVTKAENDYINRLFELWGLK